MNLQDLGSIGEFVGALAVVASLLYLSAQIRQNTRSLRANAYKDFVLAIASTREAISRDRALSDVWRGGLSDYASLDQADRYRFDSIMARAISNFQIAREFHANGLLEDSVLEANKRTIVGLLASSGGSAWWEFAQASYEAGSGSILASTLGASATVGSLCHAAERPVRWAARAEQDRPGF